MHVYRKGLTVEVEDNHGHTTKVHSRDVKKIPMTDNICQLYKEEQVGKVREGRKAVTANKMPELGWDIAETDIQTISKTTQPDNQQTPHILQTMITIAILIAAVLEFIKTHIQKIPTLIRTVTKTTEGASRRINSTWFMQNIRESYSKVPTQDLTQDPTEAKAEEVEVETLPELTAYV